MPSSFAREKGPTTRSRAPEDEFVLFLQGVPAHCRWQELKDLVRQTALHIRQAVVYDDMHGFPTGLGQIIVKNEDEAWRTYHRLSSNGWDGRGLVVTLARTSSPTQPIAGPTKSPPCMIPHGYAAGYSTPPRRFARNMAFPVPPMSPESPIMPTSPSYQARDYVHIGPMAIGPPSPFAHVPIYAEQLAQHMHPFPASPGFHISAFDSSAFPMPPYLCPSPMQPLHETPIHCFRSNRPNPNVNHMPTKEIGDNGYGYAVPAMTTFASPTRPPDLVYNHHHRPQQYNHDYHYHQQTHPIQQRTITIQNLNPSTTTKELRHIFHDQSIIETCQVHSTPGPEGEKTSQAAVTFRTPEEANHAILLYDNATCMGERIRAIPGPGPGPGPDPDPDTDGPGLPSPMSNPVARTRTPITTPTPTPVTATATATATKLARSESEPCLTPSTDEEGGGEGSPGPAPATFSYDNGADTDGANSYQRSDRDRGDSGQDKSASVSHVQPDKSRGRFQQPLIINGSGVGVGVRV